MVNWDQKTQKRKKNPSKQTKNKTPLPNNEIYLSVSMGLQWSYIFTEKYILLSKQLTLWTFGLVKRCLSHSIQIFLNWQIYFFTGVINLDWIFCCSKQSACVNYTNLTMTKNDKQTFDGPNFEWKRIQVFHIDPCTCTWLVSRNTMSVWFFLHER